MYLYNYLCNFVGLSAMKLIINNETGEVEEVEEKNELVEKKLEELGVFKNYTFDDLEHYLTEKERFETFKYVLEKAMEENDIKTWKNEYFTATRKDDSIQKRVDTERLKEDGIYDKYLKLVSVKGGLQIKFKEKK